MSNEWQGYLKLVSIWSGELAPALLAGNLLPAPGVSTFLGEAARWLVVNNQEWLFHKWQRHAEGVKK